MSHVIEGQISKTNGQLGGTLDFDGGRFPFDHATLADLLVDAVDVLDTTDAVEVRLTIRRP